MYIITLFKQMWEEGGSERLLLIILLGAIAVLIVSSSMLALEVTQSATVIESANCSTLIGIILDVEKNHSGISERGAEEHFIEKCMDNIALLDSP